MYQDQVQSACIHSQSATAKRWHFSAFTIHVDGMELELHDNRYIVLVADECPITLAQFVQSIDGNRIELLFGYLWVC